MEQEIWKSIEGFEGYYEVSNLGRVKSVDRTATYIRKGVVISHSEKGKLCSVNVNGRYGRVSLNKNGFAKSYSVHRFGSFSIYLKPRK